MKFPTNSYSFKKISRMENRQVVLSLQNIFPNGSKKVRIEKILSIFAELREILLNSDDEKCNEISIAVINTITIVH